MHTIYLVLLQFLNVEGCNLSQLFVGKYARGRCTFFNSVFSVQHIEWLDDKL